MSTASAQSGAALYTRFIQSLQSAPALKVQYSIQPVGGAPTELSIELQKPNLARIEKGNQITIADGANITVFDKAANSFYKRPQTPAELLGLFASDDLSLWAGFFNAKAFAEAPSKNLGAKNRKGTEYNALELVTNTKQVKVLTVYLSKTDGIARQAVIDDTTTKATWLIDTKSLSLTSSKEAFAFKAPEDAKEISFAELNAAKWYTNLDEAIKAATASGRVIFVDFMATWCGPCKKLDAEVLQTEKFKALSKKAVFLKIDVDAQAKIAQRYNIEAMPTQMVLDKSGNVISTTVGYGSPEDFYAWLLPLLR
ncbi:MAG: thioredoxin domain-containing protein [Fimbriimonas sp.]